MAMNPATQEYLLPCGRDVETVWERLADVEAGRADEHELACPHCRQARAGLLAVRAATQELISDDAEPSASLTGRIMSAVRADVRRRDLLPLPTAEPGPLRISEQAVAAVLRFAADGVPGVRARRCRVSVADTKGEVALTIELAIAVSYGAFAADALDVVRERVIAAAARRIGIRVDRLDLTVTDLYDA
ncbi:MAG TPA: Asp23/Gls24 family envelope stress response protein [Streptosporangiaceae bacterium]|jgi:hypothetical protein